MIQKFKALLDKLSSVVTPVFNKVYSWIPPQYLEPVKNVLAIIGLISVFYFLIFFSISKPEMIKKSEEKVEKLEGVIKENNKEIKVLQKENKRIENEVEVLEENLEELQDKSEKYKKQYEKQVAVISKLDDNELSKLFTDTFLDYTN